MSAAPIPFIDPSEAQQGQGAPPAGPPQPQPVPQPAAPPEQAPAPEAAPAPAAPSPAAGAAAGGQAGPQANPSGGWGQRTLHGILKALDGTQDVAYQVDPQSGQMVASHVDNGPGSMAKRIIAGAVTGLAAGASAAPGPGHIQRGLAAGIGAGAQGAQARDEQARADALGNYQRLDQSKMRNAQLALTNQQLLASTHTMNREDVDAAEHYTDSYNQWEQMVGSGPENVSLGIIKPKPGQTLAQATTAAIAANPQVLALHAKGQTLFHPVVTDGKVSGYAAAIVTPAWKDQLNDKPHTYYSLRQNPKTGELETETQTIPAGAEKNGVIALHDEALLNKGNELSSGKYTSDQTAKTARLDTQARTGAELGAARIGANAETQKALIAAGLSGQSGQDGPVEEQAQALAHDRTAVSLLNKRSQSNNAIRARANEIHMKEFGTPFDEEQNEANYQSNKQTALDYAPSGKDGKLIGSYDAFLGHAADAQRLIQATRQNAGPLINRPINAIKNALNTPGSAAIIAANTALLPVKAEYDNFILNGHAPSKADETAINTIVSDDKSITQKQAALKVLASSGAIRLGSLNFGYKRQLGHDAPGILSAQGASTLQGLGIDQNTVYGREPQTTRANGGAAPSGNVQQGAAPSGTVMMRAPNGQTMPVPAAQVEHYTQRGAQVVQ